jgi:non-specific serine/threonine protein kinase
MTVVSDDFEFNFSDFPNIKSQNPCFLTQWELFFDSIEWMTYGAMAKLAKINNGTIAVLKSNFAVLKISRN